MTQNWPLPDNRSAAELERDRTAVRAQVSNLVAPNADITSAAFGTIRATYSPRQVQFALKLMF